MNSYATRTVSSEDYSEKQLLAFSSQANRDTFIAKHGGEKSFAKDNSKLIKSGSHMASDKDLGFTFIWSKVWDK